MNVELIYDRDCPNVLDARANLVKALAASGREARWTEWDRSAPDSPSHVRGYGSPTILVGKTWRVVPPARETPLAACTGT
jgi:mercuric ion transport protein